jgi:hypothetical protein
MPLIIVLAVAGVLILQIAGAIPNDAVGGGLVIGAVLIVAAVAIGIHDAWTNRRGVLGWIVNIVVSFLGAFVAAQIAGPIVAIPLLMLVGGTSSLAAAGDGVMSVALVLMMGLALLGSWGGLLLVNRWRDRARVPS